MTSKNRTAKLVGVWVHVAWYVIANVAQVIVWWAVTPEHFFWPLWSIVAWAIGLGFHIWAVRTPSTVR